MGNDKYKNLDDILARVRPVELLCNSLFYNNSQNLVTTQMGFVPPFYLKDELFDYTKSKNLVLKQFKVNNLSALGIQDNKEVIQSVGGAISYLEETQKRLISNIQKLSIFYDTRYVHLDIIARKNLELTHSNSLNQKKGSLLWLLDKTKTPMGARLIRTYIDEPIRDDVLINKRLDSVEELASNLILRKSSLFIKSVT